MRNRKTFWIALALVFCGAFAAARAADTAGVQVGARYWFPTLTAEGKVADDGIGTDINFVDDLGVDADNYSEIGLVWYPAPTHRVWIEYMPMSADGDQVLERTILFHGKTYRVGAPVKTSVDMNYLRAGWAWEFLANEDDTVKVGPMVDAKVFWIDAKLDAPTLGIDESKSLTLVVPTVGLRADVSPVKNVSLYGEIAGIWVGTYGYFFDAQAGGEYKVDLGPVSLGVEGGYRVVDVKAEKDDDFAQVKFAGPFLGLTVGF